MNLNFIHIIKPRNKVHKPIIKTASTIISSTPQNTDILLDDDKNHKVPDALLAMTQDYDTNQHKDVYIVSFLQLLNFCCIINEGQLSISSFSSSQSPV